LPSRSASCPDRQKGSHALFYRDADKRRVVVPMHGTKDLKPGTLRDIIHDLGLTVDEFIAKL
jgi:predicted RNA binding protein YcfA (HicA-like mRNA interferase family)